MCVSWNDQQTLSAVCISIVTGERVVWYDRTGSMAALWIAAIQERCG